MIILLLVILIIIYLSTKNYENFSEIDESQYIDYNVIYIKNSCNKRENINKQNEEIKQKDKYI